MNKKIIATGVLVLFLLLSIMPNISGNKIITKVKNNEIQPLNQGVIITVDDDKQQCPNADFENLYSALDYVNYYQGVDGIEVYPGEYKITESYQQHVISVDNLYLRGVEGAQKTIIHGNGIYSGLFVHGNDIEISGFTFRNKGTYNGMNLGYTGAHSINIKVHDNIFYLRGCSKGAIGLEIIGECTNVEIYNNDFFADNEDYTHYGEQKNAKDTTEAGVWYDNFWREWDGSLDEAQQGEPYEKNGVYDSSPRWEPYILSRPSLPDITVKRIRPFWKLFKYTIVSYDADGDDLFYGVYFGELGDGSPQEFEDVPEGMPIEVKHRFRIGQKPKVIVYVGDEHYLWSREPAVLNVPMIRAANHPFLEGLLDKIINRNSRDDTPEEEPEPTGGPWVRIIKPIKGAFKIGPLILMSIASRDVCKIDYLFGYDSDGDGEIEWTGPKVRDARRPLFIEVWFKPVFPRQSVTIRACGYDRTKLPAGGYIHKKVAETEITITKLF